MNKPYLSIITITYNAEDYLKDTLQSIKDQTFKDYEYIIIDGNSCDGTLDIIDQYNAYIDIVISEKDSGIYNAMNKGLKLAKGEWVTFLNAGDSYRDENTLKKIFAQMDPKLKLVYGDWANIDRNGLFEYMKATTDLKGTLQKNFYICHQSLFVKNERLPFYDESYRIKADYQWVIDIVKSVDESEIRYLNSILALYDHEGLSAKYLITNAREYMRLTYKNFGLFQVIKNSPTYGKYFLKYILIRMNIYRS
ncbi:glycosyltransferase family 2 protein [Sulfurimonas sp. ST-25]|uniref:glycosyltransferase family 2 protein n=1 Tax=Sulfurimonas sp. ST-25 TaxID=3400151 RepID=UPI003A86A460